MIEKWWKATPYSVQEIEIAKRTKSFVFMADRSNRREGIDCHGFYHLRPVKNDAIGALISDLRGNIIRAESAIRYTNEQIAKLEAQLDK